MISVIQIAIGEIKLAVRHVSFWIALIFLNILTLVTSNIRGSSGSITYTSWNLANEGNLYVYLMIGFVSIVIMRREQANGYDEIIHSLPYSKYQFVLGRYLALILISCIFIWQLFLFRIGQQLFIGKTPVYFSTYLSSFLLMHFPSIIFFSSLSILVSGLVYRYQSITITCIIILWWYLTSRRFHIVHSEKWFGNLPDFLGTPMFATMDPILKWFPETKLILLNRLIYICLAIIVVLVLLHLFRRRNELKTHPILLLSIIPLGVIVMLTVSSYLADWNVYLNTAQAIDTIVAPPQIRHQRIESQPAICASHYFHNLAYTLNVKLNEENKYMDVNCVVKFDYTGETNLEQPVSFTLNQNFEVVQVTDLQGNELVYTREGNLLTIYQNNNRKNSSLEFQIAYGGEVWEWEKMDFVTNTIIMQFVNTGWLSQYITEKAIWLSGLYAWYPKILINGHEYPASYKLIITANDEKMYISNTGHLLNTGIESESYQYELDMHDTAGLVLVSGPYIYVEHDLIKVYCLSENIRFAHNLIQYTEDKINFYEIVTGRRCEKSLVVIQSNSGSGVGYHNPIIFSDRDFSSYNSKYYPYHKVGAKPMDVKLAFRYLAHQLDSDILGLNSIALGIGSYIDSLYIKQIGFNEPYEKEYKHRLALAEAEINGDADELRSLAAHLAKETDSIQISRLPISLDSNRIWLNLHQVYYEYGFDALCLVIQQMMNEIGSGFWGLINE